MARNKQKQLQKRKIARAATRITRNIGRFYEPNSRWRTDEKPGTKSRASSRMLGHDTAPLIIVILL